jgi:sugar/nucleoside kinase (ribokinase family)
MKQIELCGLGNALVDIFLDIDEETFHSLDLERGTMRLVDAPTQSSYIAALAHKELPRVSGGSVANSVIAFAQLGGKGALLARVGNDANGVFYRHELEGLGVRFPVPLSSEGHTGTVLVFVTPDSERTMRTHLGISSSFGPDDVDEDTIRAAEWIFIEGYLFTGDSSQRAVRRAVELAKRHGTKIAVTFSESWVVSTFRAELEATVAQADLIFANEQEILAYSGAERFEDGCAFVQGRVGHAVVTRGGAGAWVGIEGREFTVPAFPCHPIDQTGAGDMFAATYLFGHIRGEDPRTSARRACYLGSKVICQVGARMHDGVRQYWDATPE